MKNRILFISLAVVLALSVGLLGCAGEEEEEVLELVFSDHNPPQNPTAQAIQAYGQYIGNHSDGDVTVDVHIGGELYLDTELFGAAKSGAVDAGSYVPETGNNIFLYNVMNMPMMGWPADERDVIDIALTLMSEFPEIQEEFTDQGLYYATTRAMPPVHLHYHNNLTFVDEPSDLVGMKIITLENLNTLVLSELGASPIKLGFADLFTALTPPYLADGFLNHFALLWDLDWLKELKSHTLIAGGMYRQPLGIVWNLESYNACLDIVGQQVMDDAYDLWLDICITGTQPELDLAADYIVDEGHTIVTLNATQLEAFETAVEPVYEAWMAMTVTGHMMAGDTDFDPSLPSAVFNRTKELIAASP